MSSKRDWTGSDKAIFRTTGATGHSEYARQCHDFYATDPKALEPLLDLYSFERVWEPACGMGHLAKPLQERGLLRAASDLYEYDYPAKRIDFLKSAGPKGFRDIITNPPYRLALEFARHGVEILPMDGTMALFLKLTFLEGKKRCHFFEKHPPKKVCVFVNRVQCALNGSFDALKNSSACAYAWFIWNKQETLEPPIIKWIRLNNHNNQT